MSIRIRKIRQAPHLLSDVIALGDRNKETLGLFPRRAFEQSARDNLILVAVDETSNLVGYLLYRIVKTKYRAAITHLCVDANHRNQGIGRLLVNRLKDETGYLRGISLYSRMDYESNSLWPRLGFKCIGEKRGRGKDRIWLSHYWYAHEHPPLLELMEEAAAETKTVRAVIDQNIFVYFFDKPDYELAVDWLLDDVAFYVTPEHYNEIRRDEDSARRQAMRRYADTFLSTRGDHKRVESIENALQPYFPEDMTDQDDSDRRHLAHAIEHRADFFVTNDRSLQKNLSGPVQEEFGLKIVNDTDLIVHLDKIMQETKYQPRRWAGTHISRTHISAGESDTLAEIFHRHSDDKKAVFRERLEYYLARPKEFEAYVIADQGSTPHAIVVLTSGSEPIREVPLLRSIEGPLSPALESRLISWITALDALEETRLIRVSDDFFSASMVTGLQENSFVNTPSGWLKLNLPGVHPAPKVHEALDFVQSTNELDVTFYQIISERIGHAMTEGDASSLIALEKLLWPLKLDDVDIPTYIVPIWPQWAAELFDDRLSRQTLYGPDPALMLKMENVYYRSARTHLPTAPSRILWYVSQGNNNSYHGTMTGRACAYVEEAIVGLPSVVFKQFSDLGVYRWEQVLEAANEEPDQEVLAFRFGRAELFEDSVPLNEIMRVTGKKMAPIGPRPLTNEAFIEIYKLGRNLS